MTTLDGVERVLDEDMVLVCDRNGPSGIAGIMGGQVSEVSEQTTRVLLEVATWNGVNILRTSRKLACAPTPRTASRSSSIPSWRSAHSASPRGCWSSSAGPGSSRGRSTRRPSIPSRTG